MSDDESLMGWVNGTFKNWRGDEMAPDKMVQDFHLYGHDRRAVFLDQFDKRMSEAGDIPNSESAIRDFATARQLRNQFDKVHRKLRDVNR